MLNFISYKFITTTVLLKACYVKCSLQLPAAEENLWGNFYWAVLDLIALFLNHICIIVNANVQAEYMTQSRYPIQV
ncbi:Uncharacterized protein APZ42_026799 [Daphnia magna]|uniref:Uncharacterized protein n=1 Tax=Daphnia magna TaxID=35525 RepID=A0A164RY49_9CRUS|nr:Uncharacterized protein APZ42_026799 [Daphnia magna]